MKNTVKRTGRTVGVLLLGLLLAAGFAFQASAAAKEISASKAKKLALKDANVKKSAAKYLKAEKDRERN